jgi:hypothetical protein
MDAKRSRGNPGRGYCGRGRGGRGGGGQLVSTVMTEEGMEELIQRTTQAMIASLTVTDDVSVITTPTTVDANSTANPNNTKRTTKSVIPEGALKKFKPTICKIHMSNVRRMDTVAQSQISLLSACSQESSTHTVGYLDEDSHADMHCARKNCVMLSTTGFSCDVSPFHDQYKVRKDVEIVKSATAYQHPNRQVM